MTFRFAAVLCATLAVAGSAATAAAQAIVQDYYVPLPEAQVRATFLALAPNTNSTMDSVVSIVVAVTGTRVHYDHWEDGYEADFNSPVQSTTRIWGDGNNANGVTPGYANDPASLPAGTVIALRNLVTLPRNAGTVLYDGRDHVGATRGIVMSRAAWSTVPGPLLADAVAVDATIDWGTSFVVPLGENVVIPAPATASFFELTSLFVMAQANNTLVQVDVGGNGTIDYTATINQGESYQVQNGITAGTTVTASKPVQVDILTGDIAANYESRWYAIPPLDQWTPQYYSPVGTASNGEATYLFLYNPNASAITINYLTQTTSGSFSVPAKSTYTFLAPQNSGTRFTSAGGQDFFAVGAAGAALNSNNVHDWGFSLVPSENLTTEAVVGWGPGSSNGTQNGNPVWVTPVAATTIYVDYNGDRAGPLTDPNGGRYDVAISSAALQVSRVFEPDKDQTGMRLYTLDGTLITAAWGQDPATAGPGEPYLDIGTTIPNFPVPTMTKSSTVFTDIAPLGVLNIGDILEYTITLNNQGLVAIGNTVVLDTLPSSLTYLPASTSRDGTAIPDSANPTTLFPLDEGGYIITIIPRRQSTSIKFRATINATGSIINTATGAGTSTTTTSVVPPGGAQTTCIADFTNSGGTTVTSGSVGTAIYVKITDADENTNSSTTQTLTASVVNSTNGDYETISLPETTVSSGIFLNTVGLATSSTLGTSPNDGTLNMAVGDSLSIVYNDPTFGDTCNDTLPVSSSSVTKILYLDTDGSDGDTVGDLDRVDPVASADATTSATSILAAPTSPTVTAGATTTGSSSNTSILTFSHTPGSGSNRLLIVAIAAGGTTNNSVPGTISGVTYNGTAMTPVGTVLSVQARTAIYALANPVAGPANVVVTMSGASSVYAAATTFTNVDISSGTTSALATYQSTTGATGNPAQTYTAGATGQLIYSTAALDEGGTNQSVTTPGTQTQLWNSGTGFDFVSGAGSTKAGAASVSLTYTSGDNTQEWAAGAVGIKPAAASAGGSVSFVQTPTFCSAFTLPSGAAINAQAYFGVDSGSMIASPSITATLEHFTPPAGSATTIATSTSAASDGTRLTFTFPALASAVTVPIGNSMRLVITNNQTGVTFHVNYDSTSAPSFVSFGTTSFIRVSSVGIYDAAYSGGSIVTTANNSQTLYVRTTLTDPFGAYDITSVPLTIDGPGAPGDISTTLTASNVVNTATCTKTYEYAWATGSTEGTYNVTVVGREGLENTVTDTKSTSVSLSQLDLGTPCSSDMFTTGSNGPSTTVYAANEQICVKMSDQDQNTNSAAIENVTATVTTNAGDTESYTLVETTVSSGIFVLCKPASSTVVGSNNNGTVYAPAGSIITVAYTDPTDALDVCNDSANVPATVSAIDLTKTLVSPTDGQIRVGEAAQFRIRVTNTGNTALTPVALTDTFPAANLTYVSATPSPNTVGSGTLSWTNVGPLAVGSYVDIVVNFTGNATTASAVNSATATSGAVSDNGTANVQVTNPALAVTKTLTSPSPGPANKGTNVVWTIQIQNTGTTTINTLPFEDTYSGACFTFVTSSITPDGTGFGSVVWSDLTGAGSLAPAGSLNFTVTLQASGNCAPATNSAAALYVTDAFNDTVPPVSSSATITTLAASISGFVYDDEGAAGFGGGDLPLEGVTVTLYTDPNGDGNPADGTAVAVTQSFADGSYEFTNLGLGNYVVVETDPIGYSSVADTQGAAGDNRVAVVVNAFTSFPNNNFLDNFIDVATYGSIAGQVRNDTDGDGDFGDADSGIASATIDLYTDPNGDGDPSDGVIFLTTTTNGSGNYSFPGIPPGSYVVVETTPSGYTSTADVAGANDDRIAVTVPASTAVTGRNFLDTQLVLGSVGDRVWVDEDGDGAQDAGEDGIAGVTVRLYDSTGAVLIASTTTDTDGRYIFTGVTTGSHIVRVDTTTMPAGLAANPTFDLDGTGTANQTAVTAVANTFVQTADFGYNWVPVAMTTAPTLGATGTIGDRIWNDADSDGVQDFGEAGISGVTVRLLVDSNGDGAYGGAGDTAAVTTTTDANGRYIFDGIAPGSYVVDVVAATLPAGFTTTPTGEPDGDLNNTTRPIVIGPGDVWLRGDFGYTRPTGFTIGDTIWLDADADGTLDAGEPGLVGVTVTISTTGGAVIASTTTDANGNYSFPNLPDGTYVVSVTDTNGILVDTPTVTATPAGGSGRASTVTISGASNLAQDFGFAPLGHTTGEGLIGDTIWLDRDADLAFDAGEGLEGITVQLYDSTDTTLLATTVTDASGRYIFGNLSATTTYVVRVLTTTLPNSGTGLTNSVDPDGGTASRATTNLNLFSDGIALNRDFAYTASTPNTISGTIWNDTNADGTLVAGETGRYAGVIVVLRDSSGDIVATTTTNASGDYSFTGLPSGTYTVDVDEGGNVLGGLWKSNGASPGANDNSQVDPYSVTVTGGTTNATADFGYYGLGASLGNFVWNDTDFDGIQDAGELGLPSRPVTLTITWPTGDVTTIVSVTDAAGAYAFYNLLLDENFDGAGAGEPMYSISTTTPSGYTISPIGAGGNAQTDSNNPAGTSATASKGVVDTTTNTLVSNGYDFGFALVADVQVVKTGSATVVPGNNVVYTIVVTNNGPASALAVSVADPTPSGLSFVSNTGDCTGAYPCSLGTLASGATRTITTTYSVPPAYTTPNPIVNTATVSTTTVDTNSANDTSTANTTVTPQADVAVVKTGPATVVPGSGNISYTVVVTNNGPSSAAAVSVADPTPSGLGFVSNTGDCTSAYPCSLGTLASGATRTITSTYSVPAGYTTPNPLVNTATVSTTTTDTVPGNDSSSASSTVTRQADLSITKTDGTATYTAGGTLTYTIVASNAGPSNASSSTVTDTFPPQLNNATWTCSGTGGGTCAASGSGNLNQSVNLPSGASVTFVVSVDVIPGATVNPLTNTATVAAPLGVTDPTPGNNTASDSDTPVVATASLGDRLWVDEDGDGQQDAGEDGIAGVTVRLFDATGVTLLATTTTDSDGRYLFTGLAAANYVVRVNAATLPAGLAANPTYDLDNGTTNPNGETLVTAVAGTFVDTADFGYNWVPAAQTTSPTPGSTGTIGDRIWNDADSDGVQDFGESGISGVQVRLLVDSNGDGVYGGAGDNAAVTTTTNSAGNYIFDGLAPGAYVVNVNTATLPAGFTTTPTGDPDGDLDNTSNPVVIAPGDVWLRGDFGYNRPTAFSIGDTIYLDSDADGVRDAGEPGISGVTVVLRDSGGNFVASTITDASGLYLFPGIANGTYSVTVTDSAGVLLDTPTNTGDPDGGGNRTSSVVISGASNLAQDFGFAPSQHESGDGLIGDTIFLDRDGDLTFDSGEGIQGVTVSLYDSTNTTLIAQVVTDPTGQYVFGGLDATATYVVRVEMATLPNAGAGLTNTVDPDGGTASRSTVDLTLFAGGVSLTQDFGYSPAVPNTISGTIWNDTNADGTLGGAEAVRYAGAVVVLRDSAGQVVGATATDASGNYSFTSLPNGTYSVDVAENGNVLGGLWKSNGPSAGSDSNSQPDAYTVSVTGGITNTTADFGYYRDGASLGNYVWSDIDNDGIQDVGEAGISGAVVTLAITYPTGDVTTIVTATNGAGAYSFGNLLLDENFDGAGGGEPTFQVSVSTPFGYQASPVGAGGDPLVDSNNHAGAAAIATRGVTNTVDDTLANNGIDFGFAPVTDVGVVKSGPVSVVPGNNVVFTVVVTNNGPSTALGVSVADPTPAGLSFVSNTGDCTTAYPCALGTLTNGATRTITTTYSVPASYTTPNPIVNTATVSTATIDTVSANNSDDASVNVTPQADVALTKTGPASATPGTNVVYTIVVTNNGVSNAAGVSVTDPAPSGLSFVSNSGDCTTAFPCSLGTLAPGATRTITTTFAVPASYTTPNPIVNTATASSTTPDPVPGNDSDSESTPVTPSADMAISKSGPGAVTPGTNVTYTIIVTNYGVSDAAAVSVADPTPSGLTFVSNTGDCTTTFPCSLGTVAAGSSRTITSTFSVPLSYTTPDPVVNTATVSSTTPDPVPGNNTDDASSNISAVQTDLAIVKTGPVSVAPGANVVYTLVVTNNGPNPSTNTIVTDPTPGGLTLVSNTGHCTTAFPCSLGTIPSGQTRTITSTYSVPASYSGPDPISNTAIVGSDEGDATPGNNASTALVDVDPSADVAVVKSGPATAVPGNDVAFTVVVTNNGPSNAAAVSVADPTPAGLTFVSNTGDCTTAYPCALGTLTPGATRTITSTFSVPASYTTPNPIVNTATVSTTTNDTVPANDSDSHSPTVSHEADLSITKDDGTLVYTAGGNLTYTITVTNAGPSSVVGGAVADVFPPQLHNVTWTCSGTGGGTCGAAGSGDINDTVNLPVGGSVTYLASVSVIAGSAIDPLTNTATVTTPVGTTDPTPGNNSDDDQDSPTAAAASLGDRLWLDEDGDGVQDAGEDGLAGVSVGLYNAAGTVLIATTTTDTDGRYVFTGLAAGSYVVRVDTATLPAGLAANPTYDLDDGITAPDSETAIAAVAGAFVETGDFGFNWVTPSSSTTPTLGATGAIGDRIWNDADGDGVQDFGEAGIGGVTVRLVSDDNGDGVYGSVGDAAALSTTTDAAGNYIFDNLTPGAYVIRVDTTTLPAGFTTTPTGDPDSDGDSVSEPVVVAPGDVWVRGDFGYTLPGGSTIGDTIYLDADADGLQGAGEPGLEGVTVMLLDGSGNVVASTVTDASGNYFFRGLPDGTYSVLVTDTAGVLFDTPTNTGDPDGGNDRTSTVVLAGADDLDQDFGFAPAGHGPGDGLIGDTIFLDRNADGLFDSGEGIEGVTVELYDSTGTVLVASLVTDATGRYVFGGLDPAETYIVRVDTLTLPGGGAGLTNTVDPDAGLANRATVDLSAFADGITLDQDFGYEATTPNTIGGTLWNDSDGDGTLEAGETTRFAGIVVVLRDSDGNVVATTTTDASGNYEFSGLPDGTYTLDVAEDGNALGGLTHSDGPSAGSDNNSQGDTYTVTVAGGATDTTGDFGYFPGGAAVGNFVWSDTDNDGVQDLGEPGIAGVEVTLEITWPSGDVTTIVTVTDALGAYSFAGLLLDEDFDGAGAGEPTYSISVATPAGYQTSVVGAGGNAQSDSNDHTGAAATAAEGVTDTSDDALTTNGFDFGFTPLVDVAVVKSGPASVVPGTNAVFTVVVTNNGPGTAQAVSVADPTPSGLSFVSNTGDCTTAYPCSLGALASGATRTITTTYSVPASYTTPDPVVNTATVSTTSVDTVPANDSDSASAPVDPSADMAIVKTGPGAVTPGTNIVYTILVTNNGTSDAAGVSVADPTPSGLTFVSNTGDCTTAFPCSLGTVPAGATRTITTTFSVPLSYTTPDPIVNTATVSSTTPDPVPGNNTDDASTNLSSVATDLAITKTGPALTSPGTNVVFTIIVTNNGPATATSTTVTDPTPGGLTFVSNTGDCTTAYPCSLGTLANGETRTITSTYSAPPGYAGPNPISNTAVVSSAEADTVPGNNSDTDTVPVSPSADVGVVKSGPSQVVPGTNAVFTIVVTNNGPSNASAVSVADPTPAGLTFVSNAGSCTTAYPCALGTLAPGATRTITTTYAVPLSYAGPDPVVNAATVSTATPDPIPANDSDSHSAPVAGVADLAVTKSDPGTGAIRGGTFSYTIVVTNNGPEVATNVTAVDTLDSDTTYVSDSAGCTGGATGTLNCALGTLAAGASTSFTVTVTVDSTAPDIGTRENGTCIGSEDLCNSVTVDATEPDPVLSNNTDTEPTNVSSVNLTVVKSDSGQTMNRLEDFAYTIVVTNTGVITATNVTAVDTLDAFTTFVSSTIPCTEAPAGRLTCSIGTLASGASSTFYVVVQVDADAPIGSARESGPCNGGEDLCNSVTVTAAEGVASTASSTDDEPTNVQAVGRSSDLSITKVNAGGAVQAGSFATYTISVRNSGPGLAMGVQVIDTLDPNTEYAGSTVPCTVGLAGLVTCDLGDMASGATIEFEFVVHVDPSAPTAGTFAGPGCPGGEDICNRASVSSTSSDPDPLDNVSSASTNVIPTTAVSQLSLTKEDLGAEPVQPGSSVTYQIVVSNAGPNAANDVVVYETLDPYMTHVSDTAGCVATTATGRPNTTLACPLGTIPAGSAASLDLVVTLSADAPVDSTMQDGDCDDLEDVCNDAMVTTSSADFVILDNQDSEPTDVSLSLFCNDGIIDPGEQCDPPDGEVCNNGSDDDGDNVIDCGDPDCQITLDGCNGNCLITPSCQPILNDPAKISWNRVYIHGRYIPRTDADPFTEGFKFVIGNENGEIYTAELLPGDMRASTGRSGSRWLWKDRSAKDGPGRRGGLFRVGIHQRNRHGEMSYVFTIKGYGDMSAATLPLMTSQVYIGDDTAYLQAEWLGKPGAWYLTPKQAYQ